MNSFFASSEGKVKWWIIGIIYTVNGYITSGILVPLITNGSITQKKLLVGIPIWMFCGLIFGFFMKIYPPKGKKSIETKQE